MVASVSSEPNCVSGEGGDGKMPMRCRNSKNEFLRFLTARWTD